MRDMVKYAEKGRERLRGSRYNLSYDETKALMDIDECLFVKIWTAFARVRRRAQGFHGPKGKAVCLHE